LRLDPAAHRITGNGQKSISSDRVSPAAFLHDSSDRVYSRAQLLDEVWGDHVFVEERTVDVTFAECGRCSPPAITKI